MNIVELGKALKQKPEVPTQNGQKSPLATELSRAFQTIYTISQKLRQAQNGNPEDNQIAERLINSLQEIRSRVIAQLPQLVWSNPALNGQGQTETQTSEGQTIVKPKTHREQTSSNVPTPEGFLSVDEVCVKLGISYQNWSTHIRRKYSLTNFKIGQRLFYKKEDIESIAAARQQKATQRAERRVSRESQLDRQLTEFDGEDKGGGLDLVRLHFNEIIKIPPEVEKHKLWGAKISAGQLALLALRELSKSPYLSQKQQNQIEEVLENNVSKFLLRQFHDWYNQRLSKANNKKDKADRQLIKSFEGILQSVEKVTLEAGLVGIGEIAEQKLQSFIEAKLNLVKEAFEARNNFIEANLRLVANCAKRFSWSGMELSDLIGYGYYGLMKAVARWDFRKGYKFSTFAIKLINRAIIRAIANYGDAIRLPVHMQKKLSKFKKTEEKLVQETNGSKSFDGLANEFDKTGNLSQAIKSKQVVSLSTAVGPNKDSFLEDFLEDVKNNIEEASEKVGLREALMEVLNTLPAREKKVLILRYGIEDDKTRTLEQVAKYFGVTRERIRQIESKALRKLQHPSRARKLRGFLDDDPKATKGVKPGVIADARRRNSRMLDSTFY